MSSKLALLVLSLCICELVHNLFEIWGMRQKVSWLTARMDNTSHGRWPINIDTKTKTALAHFMIFIILNTIALLTLSQFEFTATVLLKASIIVLLTSYAVTTLKVDAFHTEIGRLLSRYKIK